MLNSTLMVSFQKVEPRSWTWVNVWEHMGIAPSSLPGLREKHSLLLLWWGWPSSISFQYKTGLTHLLDRSSGCCGEASPNAPAPRKPYRRLETGCPTQHPCAQSRLWSGPQCSLQKITLQEAELHSRYYPVNEAGIWGSHPSLCHFLSRVLHFATLPSFNVVF